MPYRSKEALDRRRAPRCDCGGRKASGESYCPKCKRARKAQFGPPPRPLRMVAQFPNRLPLDPLATRVQAFVDKHAEPNADGRLMTERVLAYLGLDTRRYNEWVNRRGATVSLELADRVLTRAGWDWGDVWDRESCPQLMDALEFIDSYDEAEADGFCPQCCEWVVSVQGRWCPWHPNPVVVSDGLGEVA